MVEDIRASFVERVNTLEWMDEETRAATLRKANNMRVNIAFPQLILTQGGVEQYYEGVFACFYLEMEHFLSQRVFSWSLRRGSSSTTWWRRCGCRRGTCSGASSCSTPEKCKNKLILLLS
jgi:Peptidase family M13